MRRSVLALVLACTGAGAQEKKRPSASDIASDKVLAAFRAKDDKALAALALQKKPGVWWVAHKLCLRGEHDAAAALVKTLPAGRPEYERLPQYVERMRTAEPEPGAIDAMAAFDKAYPRNPLGGLRALATLKADREQMFSVNIHVARALAYRSIRKPKKSATSFEEAGRIAEVIGWLSQALLAYNHAGIDAHAAGDLPVAERCTRKLLALSKRLGNAKGAAMAAGNLGAINNALGRYEQAMRDLDEALALARKLKLHDFEAKTLRNLSVACQRTGKYERGLAYGEEALRIYRQVGNQVGIADTVISLGNIYSHQGQFHEAEQSFGEALAIYEKAGNEHGVAAATTSLAGIDFDRGDYKRAAARWESARQSYARLGNRLHEARALGHVALVQSFLGDYDKSLAMLEEAYAMQMRLRDRPNAALTLMNIGRTHAYRGDPTKALAALENALKMMEAMEDPRATAKALANLGGMHAMLNDFDKAAACVRTAFGLFEGLGDQAGMANQLANLGRLYARHGKKKEARESMEQALALHEKQQRPLQIARTLADLGRLVSNLGEMEKGVEHMERALRIVGELGDDGELARIHHTVGRADLFRGDRARARQQFGRGVAAAERSAATPALVDNLSGLARVSLLAHEFAQAIGLARRAVAELPALLRQLGEVQGARARGRFAKLYATGAVAALYADDVPALCHFLESGRAGTFLEALSGRETLRSTAIPFELREQERQALAKEAKAVEAYRAAVKGQKLKAIRAARKNLEAVRGEVADAVEKIRREAKSAAEVFYPKLASLEEIQKTLREDEALVLFGVFNETLALVVTAKGARHVSLGRTAPIEAAVAKLLPDALGDADNKAPDGAALRKLLIDPLGLEKTTRRVLVSPHGALAYVPFALLDSKRSFAYVPSGTAYRSLAQAQTGKGRKVLAVGDPAYDGALPQLPAAGREAEAVGDRVLLGKDATKARFLEAAPSSLKTSL